MRGSAEGWRVSFLDIAIPEKTLKNLPCPHFPPSELPLIRPPERKPKGGPPSPRKDGEKGSRPQRLTWVRLRV
jgi:hypothetical protein